MSHVTHAIAVLLASGVGMGTGAAQVQSVRDEVIAAEGAWSSAARAGDVKAWSQFIANDCVWFGISGEAHDKAARVLVFPKGGLAGAGSASEAPIVRVYGNTAGVVVAREMMPGGRAVRVTRVWLKGPSGWGIVSSHATVIGAQSVPIPRESFSPADVPGVSTRSGYEAELSAAERTRADLFATHDAKAFAALMSEDYVQVGLDGVLLDKAQRIERLGALYPYELNNVVVRVYGDIGVVTATQQSNRPARITRVWVRDASQWVEASYQAVLVAKSAGP